MAGRGLAVEMLEQIPESSNNGPGSGIATMQNGPVPSPVPGDNMGMDWPTIMTTDVMPRQSLVQDVSLETNRVS